MSAAFLSAINSHANRLSGFGRAKTPNNGGLFVKSS